MVEGHGVPEAGQPLEPGPEVIERNMVAKERATQRVRSWTAQNEMRGVLALMTASAA